MKKRILSRTAFCQKCYERGDPHDGQYFAVHGSGTDTMWIRMYQAPYKREECLPLGYTPHLFTVDKVLASGMLQIRMSCAMEGCEVYIKLTDNKFEYSFTGESFILMSKKEWEFLESHSDFGYKI